MGLFIASLNSGSNGNCYYVGNEEEAVLIDAGISCKETETRMKRLGLLMNTVKAIFVSHEHTDHISGIPVLSKKYQLPVYISGGTYKGARLAIEKHLIKPLSNKQPVSIGNLSINAFSKFHDAADPYSFTVSGNAVTVGVFTDIGRCCDQLNYHFSICHAAFLEANFDADMLENGSYPYHLKKRISGGNGHLSNTEALELFCTKRPGFMSHLILSHLSKNNNSPQLVQDLFDQYAGHTKIIVASRHQETSVFEVVNSVEPNREIRKQSSPQKPVQLSFF